MKAALLGWLRWKRLQMGDWLYWRRRLKGRPVRRPPRRTRA
jgi:hypothetical protein